jgi:hypothetical protein
MPTNLALKSLRTLEGEARRDACRAHLAKHSGLTFNLDPHQLSFSQRIDLHDMAKAVCWRKSICSSLSFGAAYYVYLCKDVAKSSKHAVAQSATTPGKGSSTARARGYAT